MAALKIELPEDVAALLQASAKGRDPTDVVANLVREKFAPRPRQPTTLLEEEAPTDEFIPSPPRQGDIRIPAVVVGSRQPVPHDLPHEDAY